VVKLALGNRTRPHHLLLVGALALPGCKDEAPKDPPRKVKKKVETDRIPAPNHSPEQLTNPGKPRRVTMKGVMEADLSGKRQHFVFFPRGENAAVFYPDTKVAWVKLRGALSEDGSPSLSFTLDPLQLDATKLPATYIVGPAKAGAPTLTVTYEMGQAQRWSSRVESDKPMRLTLESLDGRTLRGTFEGTLAAQSPNTSAPIEISNGEFAVEVRLTNVERGKPAEAEAPAKPAP
jgi:hypothetical protein